MSNYLKQTKHPITGEWHEAMWMDDYYSRHHYGVQFPDSKIFNPDKTKLETRDDEPVTTNYVDSRTLEEKDSDNKKGYGTLTTASSMTYTEKRLRDEWSQGVFIVNGEKEIADWWLNKIHQAVAEERERVVERIEIIKQKYNKIPTSVVNVKIMRVFCEILASFQDNLSEKK